MKFLATRKDGGPLSRSIGFFIIEIKALLTIVLLHFLPGSREAYHTHAFNCISWVLKGELHEFLFNGRQRVYRPSIFPAFTYRSTFHKVVSVGDTWVISFRGPWVHLWREYLPSLDTFVTLTHGRKVVREWSVQ